MTGDEKFYDGSEVEGRYVEVALRDGGGEEYIYWVAMETLPEGCDEIDWAIDRAKNAHLAKGLPEIPEDPDDFEEEPYATAYAPFSRYESEMTVV